MKARESERSQSGQALVMFALFLVGLLAVLALVLDGGMVYLHRRRMQNAADAGAMAGARVLAKNGTVSQVMAAAIEYAVTRNGAATCDVTIDNNGLVVIARTTVGATFARVVGIWNLPVSARAAALWAPIAEVSGLAPIAIKDFDYQFNTPYTIWDDDTDRDPTTGEISGSYRGWLTLDCVYPADCGDAGSDSLKEWMNRGYPGMIRVDKWIRGSGGVKAATIAQAYVGQLLRIPVFEEIQDLYNNKAYYHVIKFAAFRVTAVYASGNPKGISGHFEEYFTPGPPNPGGEDGGWRTIALTQ